MPATACGYCRERAKFAGISTTHALLGGLLGAGVVTAGTRLNVAALGGTFLLPLLLWSLVSYVPFLWHPKVEITDAGSVSWFQPGMLVDEGFEALLDRLTIEPDHATDREIEVPGRLRVKLLELD